MTYDFQDEIYAGDAFPQCFPIRYGACGSLVPVGDVAAIVCTARNLGTNAIINSRNAQSVFGVNGGTYALNADGEPEFRQFFAALDTALVGSALTTPWETHTFQFTFTFDNGTIGTFGFPIKCLARPAVQLNTAADLESLRWRLRVEINELDPANPHNDWIDAALDDGAAATNDVLRYHVADNEIALVAGTADYALPSACIEFLWAEWNRKPVPLYSQEQRSRRGRWWRDQPAGPPEQYLLWGRSIIVVPTPDAAAVATDPTLLVRGCTTPLPFRLNGFVGLGSQHWEIPILYAAAKWYAGPMGARPDLAGVYLKLFGERAAAAKDTYLAREVI